MVRPLRIDYPGAYHHVMNRSSTGNNVFETDDNCSYFMDVLSEVTERYDIRVHGFALMPTHYHLMIESIHGNLSQSMSHLNGHFTQRINRERGSEGSVFRGRFHNKVVTSPPHWRYLLMYLHLNPLKARLVVRINQWRWTSHSYYTGQKIAPDWLTTEALLTEYGGKEGYQTYLKEVRQGGRERPEDFDMVLFGGRQSSDIFVVKQEEKVRKLDPEIALKQVLDVTGVKKEELYREVKGRGGNPVRTLAAWWLVFGAGQKNGNVGKQLNMSQVAVSRAIGRVRQEMSLVPRTLLSKWVGDLRDLSDGE